MATGTVILPVVGASFPATNPAALSFSSARGKLLFDDTIDESCLWTFRMPANYASAPVLKVQFSMASDHDPAHKVEFEGSIMAVTPQDAQNMDADSYDTVNRGNTTINDDLGYMEEVSITLTNADSVAAGDFVSLKLARDADATGENDNATGDAEVWAVSLEYTTS